MYSFDFFINAVRYALDKSNYNLFLKVKQYKVLESLVLGRDTVAVLPTGYGKSVVFHLLPFIFDFFNAKGGDIRKTSIVLVLTPLNALIEDQMACLRRNGIEADVLNTNDVKQTNPDNQDDGVDDEAGNNTEEEMVSIGFHFPSAPFLVLTATAPRHIRETIVKSLLLYKPVFVLANLDRPNIYIRKEKRIWSNGSDSYNAILLPIAKDLKNSLREYPLTLIYLPLKWCGYASKLFTDEIGEKSYFPQSEKNPENCLFAQFHAPQTERMKHEIMKQLTGKNEDRIVRVVFATIAIGIGVNIHDIRHVIHIGVPRTIESYYQEIGRAGRDGKPADDTLYFNGHDIATNKPGMTQAMRDFCMEEISCLRNDIMVYLGSPCNEINHRNHSCCSNCSRFCQCLYCTKSKEFPVTSCNDDEDVTELMPVRNVSDGQRKKIRDMLIAYRSQLGTKRFGEIDISTGVTLELIDSIVLRCHTIKSAEDLFAGFEVWDIKYAHAIFKIIGDGCAS